jgi:cholesterol oxidase
MMDAIIVGSGFGGAVTAARLASAGLRVLVIERGPWWGPGGDGQPGGDRRPFPRGVTGLHRQFRGLRWAGQRRGVELRVNVDGLWEWHRFPGADVLTASGVGGGSLVYTSIQEQPGRRFFDAFPPELSADELSPYYDRVREVLRPAPSPVRPSKERVFARAVAAAGLGTIERPDLAIAWGPDRHVSAPHVNAAGVEQGTCVNVGECVLGCRFGAKTSMDLTYVPMALANGAELRPLCEVTAIGRHGDGYRVRYRDHRTGRHHDEVADRLILAAGTLNTLRLLLAARDRLGTLPGLPPRLGRGVSLNGDVLRVLFGTARRVDPGEGPTITAVRRVSGGPRRHVVAEAGLPVNGLPLPPRLARRLRSSAALLAYGEERAQATVDLTGRHVVTDAARHLDSEGYAATEATMGAIGSAYRAGRAWPSDHRRRRRLLSVHPLGGAAIGSTERDGVVDHTGQVYGHPGLYVADGSLYPAAPGVPPSMTIAALAERIADLASR